MAAYNNQIIKSNVMQNAKKQKTYIYSMLNVPYNYCAIKALLVLCYYFRNGNENERNVCVRVSHTNNTDVHDFYT